MKYRKKPVVIEAFQMTAEHMDNNADWPEWLHEAWNKPDWEMGALWRDAGYNIRTLEGPLFVATDDWIIRGVKGELYPCKPDVFEMTYESAAP